MTKIYYDIDDMINMFGKRIKKAIHEGNDGKRVIIGKVMARICRKYKFWNNDIKNAYKKYRGNILAPHITINRFPNIDGSYNKYYDSYYLKKGIKSRYEKCDYKFYGQKEEK